VNRQAEVKTTGQSGPERSRPVKRGADVAKVLVNEKAPLFDTKDFNDRTVALADFKGAANVLLVFNRGFI